MLTALGVAPDMQMQMSAVAQQSKIYIVVFYGVVRGKVERELHLQADATTQYTKMQAQRSFLWH